LLVVDFNLDRLFFVCHNDPCVNIGFDI